MPRKSLRRKAIELMKHQIHKLTYASFVRQVMKQPDTFADFKLMHNKAVLKKLETNRYLFRTTNYRKNRHKFDIDDALSSNSEKYNDEEFLFTFRISRESFFLLLEKMKDRRAFKRVSKKKQQRSIAYQLLVYLFRIGKEGSGGGAMAVANYFGIAKGSVINYIRRCVSALSEIKNDIVYWPDEKQRKEMRNRMSINGFRHCVGIIDGTLIRLIYRPEAYHECYYSRKCFYALNVMIICDDKKRILYYNAGWPGSTHDNRVFRNSKLFYNRGEYFSKHEYLLGDSAYSASPVMVQAFKKQASVATLPANNEYFNTCLAKVRISSEHCIGMLKGRFQCLKQNNIKLRNSPTEVKRLVQLIGSCTVLHNLLIDYEEEEIPASWYVDISEGIDWELYDEEEEDIAEVTDDLEDRRKYVYNSFINNYL